MHHLTRYDATPCPTRTRQLYAFRIAHLHHLGPTAFPAHLRRPFHLQLGQPTDPTDGRCISPPSRRSRSSLALGYAVAPHGQSGTLFGRSGPHRHGLSSGTEFFVTHGRQHIPLFSFTDLDLGHRLVTSSSPFVRIPLITLPIFSTEPPPAPRHLRHQHLTRQDPRGRRCSLFYQRPPPPCPKLPKRLGDS